MERLMFLLLVVVVVVVVGEAPPEKCTRAWKKVGCFHDRIIPDRPYPYELVNHRDPISDNWDGHLLDWKKWPESLHALACKCGNLTRAKGYKYFGLQFYGECWTGPSEMFYRDGKSEKCIGVDFRSCDDVAETECVGKQFTNYIYRLEEETKNEEKIPGGWSDWSSWTACSAKCNGGMRSRERVCNNPEPQNGGANCEGEAEDAEGCNEEACEPVCKKKLEVGIILDGSTSVTRNNWNRTIDFVNKFSDEFVVSTNEVHFGVLHFAWRAKLDFTISDERYWTPKTFKDRVKMIEYPYGGTRTDRALQVAEEKFFCEACGLREGVPRVLLVLTDGKSSMNSRPMPDASRKLKEELNVNIMTIGVGKEINVDELHEIASYPENVFVLEGYAYLKDKLNALLKMACKERHS
ncbi:coadhesin-like [Hydractinia symbiolongicarpus]|uniref:coadhesin-like n=1 Tax=Hydractinia symbiolongicarpus TaxID=13093 RepID=UPI00254F2BA0|nr:coadhesin-like [Hydractinia symbiolongicarpus]